MCESASSTMVPIRSAVRPNNSLRTSTRKCRSGPPSPGCPAPQWTERRAHELDYRSWADALRQAAGIDDDRSNERRRRAGARRCRPRTVRYLRRDLRLFDHASASDAGDGFCRAFRHSAALRALRSNGRRNRLRDGHARARTHMRRHAGMHPGAQLTEPITVDDVLASKPIALPLRIMDCCPVSDGGAAFVVSRSRTNEFGVRILGAGQAHRHQHISALGDMAATGAAEAMSRASGQTSFKVRDARYLAIYDSFTITLCMLLEELGVAERGRAAAGPREGRFNHDGTLPLNTHGGLLSYGHCGVGGALAHLVETHLQMTGRAGTRQVKDASVALLHGDGGVLSSHVSLILEQVH